MTSFSQKHYLQVFNYVIFIEMNNSILQYTNLRGFKPIQCKQDFLEQ